MRAAGHEVIVAARLSGVDEEQTYEYEVATNPVETLDRWRSALPVTRAMDDIAADYLKLYTMV